MKVKLFTKFHNESLLKEINPGGQFTAGEHAYVMEKEFGDDFENRERWVYKYLCSNYDKLSALSFLVGFITENSYKNILSLGAGQCVLEYFLRYALPEDGKVIACDFDPFLIKKSRIFFPELISEEFDFFKDNLLDLKDKLNIHFELAVFFGSSYVMDDQEFIRLFRKLRGVGTLRIIDFQAGYISYRNFFKVIFSELKLHIVNVLEKYGTINNLITKVKLARVKFRGKFHGYARTRGELRRLYKTAGLKIIRELSVNPYKYVAVLSCES